MREVTFELTFGVFGVDFGGLFIFAVVDDDEKFGCFGVVCL